MRLVYDRYKSVRNRVLAGDHLWRCTRSFGFLSWCRLIRHACCCSVFIFFPYAINLKKINVKDGRLGSEV